jgi:hypothetical protein
MILFSGSRAVARGYRETRVKANSVTESSHELRSQIIQRARRGELTGEQADAEAERLGIGPLVQRADPRDFDPTAEPHWDVPMALSWVMTGDVAAVREVWQRWRDANEFWFWKEERTPDGEMAGHWITRHGPVGLIGLAIFEGRWRREGKLRVSRVDAEARLRIELASGRRRARGLPTGGGRRVLVPPHEWRDLRFFEERDRLVARTGKGLGPGYDDVVLWREEIVSLQRGASEPGVRLDLPTTPWLHLQYAITFALYGHAWHRNSTSIAELMGLDRRGGMRSGSVLFGCGNPEIERAHNAFDRKLSAAAFAQKVLFRGRRNESSDPIAEIDYAYFSEPRGFSLNGDWIERVPSFSSISKRLRNDLRRDPEWERVLVERASFVAWLVDAYPQTRRLLPSIDDPAQAVGTGAPGRPSSMHLILEEHRRRIDAGEKQISAESRFLEKWFKARHRDLQPPTAKTIENRIRDAHKQAVSPK